jgi:hypothetical protein
MQFLTLLFSRPQEQMQLSAALLRTHATCIKAFNSAEHLMLVGALLLLNARG